MLPELALRLMSQFGNAPPPENRKPVLEEKPSNRYAQEIAEPYIAPDLPIKPKEKISTHTKENKPENKENQLSENEHIQLSKPVQENPIDLLPVKGNTKSFETLLEESLQKNNMNSANKHDNVPKREFLKRKPLTVAPCQLLANKKQSTCAELSTNIKEDNGSLENDDADGSTKPKKEFLKKGNGKGGGIHKPSKNDDYKEQYSGKEDSKVLVRNEDSVHPKRANVKIPTRERSLSKVGPTVEQKDGVDNKGIAEKMAELDKEIQKFRSENEKLKKLKLDCEKESKRLNQKIEELDKVREQEKLEIDQLRENEMKKIQQEKRIMERQAKAALNMPNRKDKTEMEALKKQVESLQEDIKAKDLKYKMQVERLKKQNEELASKNEMLNEECNKLTQQINNKTTQRISNPKSTRAAKAEENQIIETKMDKPVYDRDEAIIEKPHEEADEEIDQCKVANENEGLNQNEEKVVETEDIEYENNEKQIEDEEKHDNDTEEYEKVEVVNAKVHQNPNPDDYDLKYPSQYHSNTNDKIISQKTCENGKIQKLYESGKKEIIFANGVKREIYPDNYTIVYFNNGDIKQSFPDGKIVYFFSEASTTQTTMPDGIQIFKFANKQLEKHFPDGNKEISFPDGTYKCIYKNGEEESVFPDGTIQRIRSNGQKEFEFQNGMKDIIQPDGTKIKEFTDGRIKIVHPNGEVEFTFKQ